MRKAGPVNITDLRKRIAAKGTEGLAAEVKASNDAKYGEGNQPPPSAASQAVIDYYARQQVAR